MLKRIHISSLAPLSSSLMALSFVALALTRAMPALALGITGGNWS